MLRQVAYETLARPERKSRHLAAAAWLQSVAEEPETGEVAASHYLAARDAEPDAPDADEIAARARVTLVQAGERAAALAAGIEGQRYFEQALALTSARDEQAQLHERAGQMARLAGRLADARAHFQQAAALLEAEGLTYAAARVTAALGEVAYLDDRLADGITLMERALDTLAEDELDPDLAMLAHQLGRMLWLAGRDAEALVPIELALETAEALHAPEILAHALNTKGTILGGHGRFEEWEALVRWALRIALEHDVHVAATRAYNNLSALLWFEDRWAEALEVAEAGLELARRMGDRPVEQSLRRDVLGLRLALALWTEEDESELLALAEQAPREAAPRLIELHLVRGEPAAARQALETMTEQRDPAHHEIEVLLLTSEALVLLGEGRMREALASAEASIELRNRVGGTREEYFKRALPTALEAALALGEQETVDELLGLVESLPPGRTSPRIRAVGARYAARRGALRSDEPTAGFAAAEELYRGVPAPLELAATQVEHAEWLAAADRADETEPLLAEARDVYERMRATPWLERIARCRAPDAIAAD